MYYRFNLRRFYNYDSEGNATNCWIIPRINLEMYMYESNASDNIHVMVSLNCPYVLDIKIEVVQKFMPYNKLYC